jgi:hypothetical protein
MHREGRGVLNANHFVFVHVTARYGGRYEAYEPRDLDFKL